MHYPLKERLTFREDDIIEVDNHYKLAPGSQRHEELKTPISALFDPNGRPYQALTANGIFDLNYARRLKQKELRSLTIDGSDSQTNMDKVLTSAERMHVEQTLRKRILWIDEYKMHSKLVMNWLEKPMPLPPKIFANNNMPTISHAGSFMFSALHKHRNDTLSSFDSTYDLDDDLAFLFYLDTKLDKYFKEEPDLLETLHAYGIETLGQVRFYKRSEISSLLYKGKQGEKTLGETKKANVIINKIYPKVLFYDEYTFDKSKAKTWIVQTLRQSATYKQIVSEINKLPKEEDNKPQLDKKEQTPPLILQPETTAVSNETETEKPLVIAADNQQSTPIEVKTSDRSNDEMTTPIQELIRYRWSPLGAADTFFKVHQQSALYKFFQSDINVLFAEDTPEYTTLIKNGILTLDHARLLTKEDMYKLVVDESEEAKKRGKDFKKDILEVIKKTLLRNLIPFEEYTTKDRNRHYNMTKENRSWLDQRIVRAQEGTLKPLPAVMPKKEAEAAPVNEAVNQNTSLEPTKPVEPIIAKENGTVEETSNKQETEKKNLSNSNQEGSSMLTFKPTDDVQAVAAWKLAIKIAEKTGAKSIGYLGKEAGFHGSVFAKHNIHDTEGALLKPKPDVMVKLCRYGQEDEKQLKSIYTSSEEISLLESALNKKFKIPAAKNATPDKSAKKENNTKPSSTKSSSNVIRIESDEDKQIKLVWDEVKAIAKGRNSSTGKLALDAHLARNIFSPSGEHVKGKPRPPSLESMIAVYDLIKKPLAELPELYRQEKYSKKLEAAIAERTDPAKATQPGADNISGAEQQEAASHKGTGAPASSEAGSVDPVQPQVNPEADEAQTPSIPNEAEPASLSSEEQTPAAQGPDEQVVQPGAEELQGNGDEQVSGPDQGESANQAASIKEAGMTICEKIIQETPQEVFQKIAENLDQKHLNTMTTLVSQLPKDSKIAEFLQNRKDVGAKTVLRLALLSEEDLDINAGTKELLEEELQTKYHLSLGLIKKAKLSIERAAIKVEQDAATQADAELLGWHKPNVL